LEEAQITDEEIEEEEQEETPETGSNSWRDSLLPGQESGASNTQRVFKSPFPFTLWLSSFVFA
jgi:hypothetical protein